MKKLIALLVIAIACISTNNTSLLSQPQIKINISGGYNLPMPDLKGTRYFSSTEENTYGMKSGINFGADGKYYLGKKRNVGITLGLNYNMFSSNIDTTVGATTYSSKAKINIFQAALGVEYSFMPKGKTNPFLGLGFTGNFFSGSAKLEPADTNNVSFELKSASRFGIRIGGGVDFMFSKSIGAVVGLNYNIANLIGKDTTASTISGNVITGGLNDKEYTVGTTTVKAKSISYIQFYAGVSFYFNRPITKKK